jgi:hypothetical protein
MHKDKHRQQQRQCVRVDLQHAGCTRCYCKREQRNFRDAGIDGPGTRFIACYYSYACGLYSSPRLCIETSLATPGVHKYVQLHAGWKIRRCEATHQCFVTNNKRKLCFVDAVYTHYQAQPLAAAVTTLAGSGSINHIRNFASTGNLQREEPAVAAAATAISTTAATATMDRTLVDSTNVATGINTAEHKPPAQPMPSVVPGALPATAEVAVATTTTAGMNE